MQNTFCIITIFLYNLYFSYSWDESWPFLAIKNSINRFIYRGFYLLFIYNSNFHLILYVKNFINLR